MRFLQTEWHKHERDRNSWEIERAEMKARIAKLEGENRAEKRLHQVYQSRITMLEKALKRERTQRAIAEGKSQVEAEKESENGNIGHTKRGFSLVELRLGAIERFMFWANC